MYKLWWYISWWVKESNCEEDNFTKLKRWNKYIRESIWFCARKIKIMGNYIETIYSEKVCREFVKKKRDLHLTLTDLEEAYDSPKA